MSQPRIVPIDDGCEVRVFEPDPAEGDTSRMYVMEAHGVSMLVYVRKDGSGTYVHVENEGIPATRRPLLVEVNNGGENAYGQNTATVEDLIAEAGLPDDADIKTALTSLTWHVTTPLRKAGITTIGHLRARSEAELLEIPQFGASRLEKLTAALAELAR